MDCNLSEFRKNLVTVTLNLLKNVRNYILKKKIKLFLWWFCMIEFPVSSCFHGSSQALRTYVCGVGLAKCFKRERRLGKRSDIFTSILGKPCLPLAGSWPCGEYMIGFWEWKYFRQLFSVNKIVKEHIILLTYTWHTHVSCGHWKCTNWTGCCDGSAVGSGFH